MLVLLPPTPNDVTVTKLNSYVNRRPRPSGRYFKNTLTASTPAPIGPNTDPTVALVTQNFNRAKLVIQNNSVATIAGDEAPTFYVGFGSIPSVGQALALPPGVGVVFDVRVESDSIYVAVGPFINTSNSVVIQGIVQESSVGDPETDTANISETGQIAQLIALLRAQLGVAA